MTNEEGQEYLSETMPMRSCTCHLDDRPSTCQHKYALTDCKLAAAEAKVKELALEHDRLLKENEQLKGLVKELADDLEAEIEARRSGEIPRRIERDLDPVRRAKATLASLT